MGRSKFVFGKFLESFLSTLPVAAVVCLYFLITRFFVPSETIDAKYTLANSDLIAFAISAAMIVFGMALFNMGTESSMTQIGELIGGSLKQKKKLFFVIAMTFMLGVLVTIAEPDLSVLSSQIGINEDVIVWTIGIGVGLFLVIGLLRVAFKKSLTLMFLAFYALVFCLGYLADPRFLPICFDSGGVTTGPVTVPFLLGFGVGLATTRGGSSSEDTFGMTALCSVGPIIAITTIAAIMKLTGQQLPLVYPDPFEGLTGDLGTSFVNIGLRSVWAVAISIVPILLFFLVYELIFIKIPGKALFRIVIGLLITYVGLVFFLTAVEFGFKPVAAKIGGAMGYKDDFFPFALVIGVLFGLFGVLAEPAVHVLVEQIENISEGVIKKKTVLLILAISIGVSVALHLIRCKFGFSIMYYLVPGYIIAFSLSFLVPKIYTAMAFDSGGVSTGPMTSSFVLPFCVGFAYVSGKDVYLYGFGLVALVALMPLIVLQALGFTAVARKNHSLRLARKRILEENDNQVIHFPSEVC